MRDHIVILLVAATVGLSSCGRAPEESLSCTGSETNRYCHLRSGMTYLGLRLGEDKRAIFENLCSGINASFFYDPVSTFDPDDIHKGERNIEIFAFDGSIKCKYWPKMQGSYAWSIRSKKSLCLLNPEGHLMLKFHANRLVLVEVECHTMPII